MKRISLFIISSLLFVSLAQPVAGSEIVADKSATLKVSTPNATSETDEKVKKLENFLKYHRSPLAPYAQVFIEKADKYDMPDWTLVPAITGVESTFGKAIPYNSYNAYGWANGAYHFASWEESIEVVTKTLKEKYINRGLTTVERIAPVYAPPSTTWASKVNFFQNKIENFISYSSAALEVNL